MKKYEYMKLQDNLTERYDIDDLNELGKKGWRVVWMNSSDVGLETTLLERELK